MSLTSYLVLMLIWLSFETAASFLAVASAAGGKAPTHVALAATLLLVRGALVALTLVQLGGCGGGSDDDGKVPPPGVDCQARPELCA